MAQQMEKKNEDGRTRENRDKEKGGDVTLRHKRLAGKPTGKPVGISGWHYFPASSAVIVLS